ncbi:MAG: class I SAM-dependent methyltransferase, partial [Promethearchaeota archaeon]
MSAIEFYCIICQNNRNFYKYLEKEGTVYIKCLECGLILKKTEIIANQIENKYDDKKYFKGYLSNYKEFIKIFNQMLNLIEKYKNPGKILDIGCGLGLFLYLAKKRGWEVSGIEISKFASNFAKNKLKLNVINSDNLDIFQDNFFDVIVVNHVLEHIKNPLLILRQIEKKLNINGILFIGVPNINGLFPRFQKENWPSLQPSTHFYQFTPKTL